MTIHFRPTYSVRELAIRSLIPHEHHDLQHSQLYLVAQRKTHIAA